ncbi:MAG: type I-E CRISPR-associated protein Cas5/CasD [Gammaproteobacteria bacterium]|jgi:CRISPR system Cascade subunit CasD
MKALILRLDAPLVSFGGVMIDQHGVIDRFPGHALLTGLIGNALGWRHGDGERLQALQARLRLAARWDVAPTRIVDYHTVDLGQAKMCKEGWTTRGVTEHRDGGTAAKFGTHQRYRHYWADGLMTTALTLVGDDEPTLDQVHQALQRPARPLFIGRKTCLPARPLLDPARPILEGETPQEILARIPLWQRDGTVDQVARQVEACWTAGEGEGEYNRVADRRDWISNLPAGSTVRIEGLLEGGGA